MLISLFACVHSSHGAAQVRITDGINTYTVADNSPDDGNVIAGFVQVSVPPGLFPGWSFILVAGASKPVLGSTNGPRMDVNWTAMRSAGAANALTISFTDNGFNLAAPVLWTNFLGGSFGAGVGSADVSVNYSSNNVLFGTDLLSGSSILVAGPGPFGSNSMGVLPAGSSYSFTPKIVLGQSAGQFTSGDCEFLANAPVPPGAVLLPGGFRFRFYETPGTVFQALAATNIATPLSNWTVLGPVTEFAPGGFEFTDADATNHLKKFYQVRMP